jgi:hypothetical protein
MFSFSVGVFGVGSRSCSSSSSIRELFSDAILNPFPWPLGPNDLSCSKTRLRRNLRSAPNIEWIQIVREGGDLPNWGKARAGENCIQMPHTTNPDLLNNGKWGVGRRSSPKCFACNGTFENRLQDIREVRLTRLSLCEASTAAIKPWGCWDSKSAPEILALTFKRHAIARMANTWRTAAALRFNWSALFSLY